MSSHHLLTPPVPPAQEEAEALQRELEQKAREEAEKQRKLEEAAEKQRKREAELEARREEERKAAAAAPPPRAPPADTGAPPALRRCVTGICWLMGCPICSCVLLCGSPLCPAVWDAAPRCVGGCRFGVSRCVQACVKAGGCTDEVGCIRVLALSQLPEGSGSFGLKVVMAAASRSSHAQFC